MNAKTAPLRSQAPRNTTSIAAKRADRARAEAEGFALIERETNLRREKTERLKKLREAQQAKAAKAK